MANADPDIALPRAQSHGPSSILELLKIVTIFSAITMFAISLASFVCFPIDPLAGADFFLRTSPGVFALAYLLSRRSLNLRVTWAGFGILGLSSLFYALMLRVGAIDHDEHTVSGLVALSGQGILYLAYGLSLVIGVTTVFLGDQVMNKLGGANGEREVTLDFWPLLTKPVCIILIAGLAGLIYALLGQYTTSYALQYARVSVMILSAMVMLPVIGWFIAAPTQK
ncbi:hypothetical protein [Pseudomonas putida]|uniref:Uncharacterized protein n=1 Tax=Pseudomonas putida TaxID=303 RepID=A0A8I1JKI4_PSEPU|nr:hypothetical protein [Pseudomonas putida]MBI6885083.1 hypothetical protein [Pseudomonas putida]